MLANTCTNCKGSFDRIDLWPHPEKSREFICRNCQRIRRLKKEKSFESDFRRFRERRDYVSPEETFQTNQSRISDDEFDEIIQEFEQAHWTNIPTGESQTHQRYIESLLKREFWQRSQNKYRKNYEKIQQTFDEPDIAIHYSLLGVRKIPQMYKSKMHTDG